MASASAGAVATGGKEDAAEDTRVRLVPRGEVRRLVVGGEIRNGVALAGLLLFQARREAEEPGAADPNCRGAGRGLN